MKILKIFRKNFSFNANKYKNSIDSKSLRYNFSLEDLPFDLNIPDWVMLT